MFVRVTRPYGESDEVDLNNESALPNQQSIAG